MAKIIAAVIAFFIFSGALFFTLTGPLELAKDYSESSKTKFQVQAEPKWMHLLRNLSDSSCSSTNTPADNYKIGEMYWNGQGRSLNDLEAIKCYELSANGGYIDAQYRMGQIRSDTRDFGTLNHYDISQAFKWFQMCSVREEFFSGSCLYELALLYETGIPGMAPDRMKYFELLDKARKKGEANAVYRLNLVFDRELSGYTDDNDYYLVGNAYNHGIGVERNFNEARRWLKKGADNNKLPVEGQYQLALMYAKGQGGPQDLVKARELFLEADDKKKFRLFKLAAENDVVEFYADAGNCYFNAIGVQRNFDEARKWLQKAANNNKLPVEGQYQLALMLFKGQGGARDYKEARNLFRQAVENGHAAACFKLSTMYTNGLGVEKDLIEAHRLLKLAGRRHYTDAQYWLGVIYYHGWAPVERSYGLACWWFAHAALKGHPGARFGLASCYANGLSVRKDEKRAHRLYLSAALAGHRGAQSALKSIRDKKTL